MTRIFFILTHDDLSLTCYYYLSTST